jgi:hypothetical protein
LRGEKNPVDSWWQAYTGVGARKTGDRGERW